MTENAPFDYITYAEARQALALRLNDAGNVFWADEENGLYLKEALRVWNCLTQFWVEDWQMQLTSASKTWQSTANNQNGLVGSNPSSPRFQQLNDAYCYSLAEYHLLEPPTGATWTGTNQFTIQDFSQALERRRDAILQIAACNVGPFSDSLSLDPGTSRAYLPDSASASILDVRRVRFVPAEGQGSPSTLFREDGLAFEYFDNAYLQTFANPTGWDVLAGPPLALTFNAMANVPNTLDILAMRSGGTITPPTASPLLIPDDFYWVLKFGMLADVLRKDAQSMDLERAAYCEQRFREGLRLMMEMPWLLQARVNGIPVDTPSVTEMDDFAYEWQSNSNASVAVVRGGIDLLAVSPSIPADTTQSVMLSLVANAPVPSADDDPLQIPRDVLDAILDEAQHLANFKMGGAEFAASMTLHENFIVAAKNTNERLAMSGIFASDLRPPVSREDQIQPRFAMERK